MKQELASKLLRSGEITRRDFAAKTASSLLGVGLLGQSMTSKSFAAFENSSKLKQIPTAIVGGKEDGMQTFNMSLAALIKSGLIKEEHAYAFSDNPEELRMNLQGIFISSGRGGILKK